MKKCYVCGGDCWKEVIHGPYTYWKCSGCFTAQVLPQPTAEELQRYYDSFHLNEADGGFYDEVEDRMKADFPAKVDRVLAHQPSATPRLLDVGCGKGFFVKAAIDRGMAAEGIDVSHSGVNYAVDTLGVKAMQGRLEERHFAEWREAFDVVTLWATIEHLSDPLPVLRAVHENLKPGGVLLCDTGLGHVFWERFLPGHSQWYDAPQHMFVFSEQGLRALLGKAGFRIVSVDTNFERSRLRRWVRWLRHAALCLGAGLFLAPLLGKRGVLKMRQEAKWPIGRLVAVVAQKT
jgi:SAM-dependent methyltransferase